LLSEKFITKEHASIELGCGLSYPGFGVLQRYSPECVEEAFSEDQEPSGACVFSPLLLLLVREGMDPAHVRAPGEVRAGVPMVVARHLIVSCYTRCGVASRRQGVVMLDMDAVFRA
jgi:hypothetical protein